MPQQNDTGQESQEFSYNLKNIRAFLTEGFTDEELRRLCFDVPDFRPVYDDLARHSGKAVIIDRLIEHAERKLQLDNLLTLAKEYNIARYEKHQPYKIPKVKHSVSVTGLSDNKQNSEDSHRRVDIGELSAFGCTMRNFSIVLSIMFILSLSVVFLYTKYPTFALVFATLTPTPTSFQYLVKVEAKDTTEAIPNAEVTIEIAGKVPLNGFTDSNGITVIFVDPEYANESATLIVEVEGYEKYTQFTELKDNSLPDTIQLKAKKDGPNIADFNNCGKPNLVGGDMGSAHEGQNTLSDTYITVDGDCAARLDYEVETWAAFWMDLEGFDASKYNTLTFWAKGDPAEGIPPEFKVEVKRNNDNEISIFYVSGLTDSWQEFSIPFEEFGPFYNSPTLSGWNNLSKLVFTFEAEHAGTKGVVYLDDIAFEK